MSFTTVAQIKKKQNALRELLRSPDLPADMRARIKALEAEFEMILDKINVVEEMLDHKDFLIGKIS